MKNLNILAAAKSPSEMSMGSQVSQFSRGSEMSAIVLLGGAISKRRATSF